MEVSMRLRTLFGGALSFSLFLCTLPAQSFYVSTSGSDANAGTQAAPWRTISHAAVTATTGGTVHIGAGTFGTAGNLEGIDLSGKNLTFIGAGMGKTMVLANIGFKRSLPYRGVNRDWWGVFLIHGVSTTVNLRDMTLDANHLESGVSNLVCALYTDGAGGTIERVEMKNAGASPPNGVQGRIGFVASGKDAANPSTIHIKDCHIHHFNKAGIVLTHDGLSGSVTGCTVQGLGPVGVPLAAQNGIQLGTKGGPWTISNNVIRDIWYTPSTWNATGILIFDARNANSITNNLFVNIKTAMYHYMPNGGSATYTGNRTANCGWGMNIWSNGSIIQNNVFEADTPVWVWDDTAVTSVSIDANSYSDFRNNSGYPTKYVVPDKAGIEDLHPVTSCVGFDAATTVALATNAAPADLVLGDFNGDGKTDFATANSGTNTVEIRFGSGGSDFTTITGKSVSVSGGPLALATGEFSGSAGLDLAVLCGDGNVFILTNNGSGTFTKGTGFDIDGVANDSVPTSLVAGQLNATGQDDLVVGFAGSPFKDGGAKVLLVSAGTITAGTALPGTLRSVHGLALADFDGNGKLDLALTDGKNSLGTNNKVQVFLAAATAGTFTGPNSLAVGSNPRAVAAGDLDGDNKLDLVCIDFGDGLGGYGETRVFLGDGTGAFTLASGSPLRISGGGTQAMVLDLQDDDDPDTARRDVAVLHLTAQKVFRMKRFTQGDFADFLGCPTDQAPSAMAFSDLNGDKLPDLLVANRGGHNVMVSLAAPEALAQLFGQGCPGKGAKIPEILALGAPALPKLGNASFKIGLQNGREFSAAILLLDTAAANPLPSAPCGFLLNGISFSMVTFTDFQGAATLPIPIPNLSSLKALNLYAQWAIVDNQGGFAGFFSMSNGLRMRLGL
jgi:hypothetical protein